MQLMEVALLGSLAAKLLDILLKVCSPHLLLNTRQHPSNLRQYLSIHQPLPPYLLHPTIPIAGVMDTKWPPDATATLNGVQAPTSPSQEELTTSKHWCIVPMPIPPTTLRSSSPSSHLPFIMVPELVIPTYTLPE